MAVSCLFKCGRISASKKHVYFVKALCCQHFSTGDQWKNDKNPMIDKKLLDILVCPLSKKPLRYNSSTSELISDKIGVTFAFRNGIPNLMPNDGRLLRKNNANSSEIDCSKEK